jgi:allantoate deiminase
MAAWLEEASKVIARCRELACFTEEPGRITRTFLSPPMRGVHTCLRQWMGAAGMSVRVDAAGNLRGFRPGPDPQNRRFYLGSHVDTVPDAGPFDGILGVALAISLAEAAGPLRFGLEVVAFSEEEGIRFGIPFLGSRALVGGLDPALLARRDASGKSVADAIRDFGLDPQRLPEALLPPSPLGYLEFHIEQGPVLEQLDLPLSLVDAIAGQSRFEAVFTGKAGHAGTTPADLRRDALAGAAEWIARVEHEGRSIPGLRATVGSLTVTPGAANVIPGVVRATLDVRHAQDDIRCRAAQALQEAGREIARRRGLEFSAEPRLDQPATPLDPALRASLERACCQAAFHPHHLVSGAGHDAMILAPFCPAAVLFLRSPGGISHHPAESVLPEDVAAALAVGFEFLQQLEKTDA